MSVRHYREYPAVSDLLECTLPQSAQATAAERKRWRRIYAKGPKPMFEMFAEFRRMINAPARVESRLDAYAGINEKVLDLIGGRDWADAPELAVIDGGRK